MSDLTQASPSGHQVPQLPWVLGVTGAPHPILPHRSSCSGAHGSFWLNMQSVSTLPHPPEPGRWWGCSHPTGSHQTREPGTQGGFIGTHLTDADDSTRTFPGQDPPTPAAWYWVPSAGSPAWETGSPSLLPAPPGLSAPHPGGSLSGDLRVPHHPRFMPPRTSMVYATLISLPLTKEHCTLHK